MDSIKISEETCSSFTGHNTILLIVSYCLLVFCLFPGKKKNLLASFSDYSALELHFQLGMLPLRVFIHSIS